VIFRLSPDRVRDANTRCGANHGHNGCTAGCSRSNGRRKADAAGDYGAYCRCVAGGGGCASARQNFSTVRSRGSGGGRIANRRDYAGPDARCGTNR